MHVVVVGGGIVGVSAAYWLAERGADVTVCERDELGSGSTDRALGGIRAQFSTEVNVALSVASQRVWDAFPERFGTEIGRRRTGYLFLTREQETADALETQVSMQAEYGVPSRLVSPATAAEIAPGVRAETFTAGTYSPADSFADPHLALQGFADAARAAGVTLRTGTAVLDLHPRPTSDASVGRANDARTADDTGATDGTRTTDDARAADDTGTTGDARAADGTQPVDDTAAADSTWPAGEPTAAPANPVADDPVEITVETDDGSLVADCVVNAAGAWSPRLAAMAGHTLPVEPHRRQIAIVEPERPVPADDPLTIDLDTTAHYRPERDGRAVVGGQFGAAQVVDPDDFSENPALDWQAEAIERVESVATYFGPDSRVAGGWAGLYAVTPDHHPVIERSVPGVVTATGFSGHGFQHAPATGRIVAELVTRGPPETVDVSGLDRGRFDRGERVVERNVA